MSRPYRALAVSLTALVSLGAALAAQPPRIAGGRVTAQSAEPPFAESFRKLVASRADVTWIGYSVAAIDGDRTMCCGCSTSRSVSIRGDLVTLDGSGSCTGCALEPSAGSGTVLSREPTPAQVVALEPSARINVLFRVLDRRVERVRVFSDDCQLDAGGRDVLWLQDVRPADSIALLESLATADAGRPQRIRDAAVSAIALHGDAAADPSLERLVAPDQPEALRKKVTFWLGNARGARGLATLRRILREDPSLDVRKSAVFGVSQSREAGAFDLLADLARRDDVARIRSEAVFWLAQRDDRPSAALILEALDKDPAADVRKKAVFALSQLRNDAGVEPLIRTARGHADPSIRGEAIFWLGQKAGTRASGAITERIEQDPDTEVKKRAVFALSQLPKDEGVPLLIQVARTNANATVRKQAMFWLGQSRDPRAIDFFAEILK